MGIEITLSDVAIVADELGIILDDAERIAVLEEVASCDVQAGPGSGKTTILTAKLAILARKWTDRDRGICVLSHTNVARREIEKKLTQSRSLSRLLHYPHFVGTIQTFVDQFLAIPFLRRERIEVAAIDNERFEARACAMLFKKSSKSSFAILKFCRDDKARARSIVGSLRLDGAQMGVTHAMHGVKGFPGPTSPTGQALISVKQALRAEGYFRYDDMYAFAEACLFKVPYITPALRRRFPWVFVDELQDTSAMQDRIIEQLFAAEGCIFQRFGDKNQAIFDFDGDDDGGPLLFGRRKVLFLNSTHRFGESVARLVSPFTAVEPQQLVGNPRRPDLAHTVFVFDRDAIAKVVPAFGDLVLEAVPEHILRTECVCVAGSRANSASHAKDNFPVFLGEYLDSYVSPKAAKPPTPDTLLGYIIEARRKWSEVGTGVEVYNCAIAGVLALIRRGSQDDEAVEPRTKTALLQTLLTTGYLTAFQKLLLRLISPIAALDAAVWSDCITSLLPMLGLTRPTKDMTAFTHWEACEGGDATNGAKTGAALRNVYLHRSGDRTVPIRFSSIHGVKGETHAATLVVETFSKQHDLKALLPVLTLSKKADQLLAVARGHCKRLFVAMSRPSHLLCLAISVEHVGQAEWAAIEASGWKVVRISA